MCTCGSHSARHYLGGQEAGRIIESTVDSSCTSFEFTIQHRRMFTGRRCGNSAESQKLKEARHYLVSAKNQNYGTIVKRYFDDEQHQMRMDELGYTQSDMEEI